MFMYLHLASPQTIQASNTWNTLYFLCILLSRFFPKYLFISLDPEALYKQIYFRIPQTPIRKLAKIWLPSSKPDIDQNCLRLAAPHHWVWKAAFTFLTMTSTIGLHYTYCRLTTGTHTYQVSLVPHLVQCGTHTYQVSLVPHLVQCGFSQTAGLEQPLLLKLVLVLIRQQNTLFIY
jgi:hypothetical protein